ncbi:hypothetical protein JTB14_002102 [Gonioctena quinquepunctata]|nr:hypothetical protein JTB14_002102 [Gonioctena quinquepunctata]
MLADLLRIFGLVGVSESKYEQYLGQLEEYMISKNLPEELRVRLLKYYEYKLQKHYFNESQIIATFSEHLQTEMFLYNAREYIEKDKILKTVPRNNLGVLLSFLKCETFLPMDIITRAGTKVDNVYFILSGTVAVINFDDIEILHLGEGDEFGTWVAADGNIIHTHIAVEISELLCLPKKKFKEFLNEFPDVSKYYEGLLKRKTGNFSTIDSSLEEGGDNVISALRAGKLLERQNLRTISFDNEI